MSIRKKRNVFVMVGIFIVGIFVLALVCNNVSYSVQLDEVRLNFDNKSNSNLAIMVEKEDGTGYEEVDSFPTNMIFNSELSGCNDADGNKIDGTVEYVSSTNSVKVKTKGFAYCYLFFDYNEPPTITSVTKTSDEQTSITISVVASDDATTYYYKINDNEYVSSTSSTYTFTGLTKGTKYSISVYVVDDNGAKSNVITNTFSTKATLTVSEEILVNPTTGLNTTLEGGLYRYQGTSVDNYICFGTSDKDTCLKNADAHMYRIIGITEDGKIKVMKNYALNTAYYWHNSYSTDITWPNSDLYKGLNGISGGEYSNLFIGNISYVPSGWEDKIETTTWKYGDNTVRNTTAEALYNTENAWTNTTNAKIGLIYAHDYYYAYQSGGLNCSTDGVYDVCKTSWMYLAECDSETPSDSEWTMSRYGIDSEDCYGAYFVEYDGFVGWHYLHFAFSVRPVFYLKSTVQFEGGTGISTDPFIVS